VAIIKAGPKHQAFRDAVVEVMRTHSSDMQAIEQCALLAHLLGQVIAMQDQRKYSPAQVMDLVAQNIEQGNREFLENLAKIPGTSA